MLTPFLPPRQRPLVALMVAVVVAALVVLFRQMQPADRGSFPTLPPPVYGPAPPWAAAASPTSPSLSAKPRWPVLGGDGTVRFVDVAQEAGLHYQWTIPGPRPLDILQTIGNGGAFLDYNNNGNLDILLVGPKLALYKGDGHGHFTDVTHAMGLDKLHGHFLGCATGDYDNDGYEDLYISGYRTGLLLHNDGGKRFTDVTQAAGLKPQPWGTACAFADVDGDGRLDLYVGNYAKFDPAKDLRLCNMSGHLASCGPLNYQPEHGILYHNEGGGKFRDVSDIWHPSTWGKTLGAAFADYDGSGRQGLAVANDEMWGELHQNQGSTFKEVGRSHGEAVDARMSFHGGMGIDWGDYDNDGRLDQVIATFQTEPKCIYHNEGSGFFKDRSDYLGMIDATMPQVAFGVKWIDFDNSGWLSLMIANGHVEDNAAQVDPSTTYRQPTQLFRNLHGKRFADISTQTGRDLERPIVGRGLAIGDFDNDGRVDALVVDSEGKPLLLHNQSTPVGHWITLKLVGTKSNRDGIGAIVTVTAGPLTQTRLCHTDGSYLSASDVRVHVGLDKARQIDSLTVQWPSGHRDTWRHLVVDRQMTLREGTATPMAGLGSEGLGPFLSGLGRNSHRKPDTAAQVELMRGHVHHLTKRPNEIGVVRIP